MSAISRYFSYIFFFALVGAAGVTLIAPYVFNALLTPPMSFGQNCAPAGEWSMSRLAITQATAAVAGMVVGFVFAVWLRPKKKPKPV